jgi:hypothetical protein
LEHLFLKAAAEQWLSRGGEELSVYCVVHRSPRRRHSRGEEEAGGVLGINHDVIIQSPSSSFSSSIKPTFTNLYPNTFGAQRQNVQKLKQAVQQHASAQLAVPFCVVWKKQGLKNRDACNYLMAWESE